MGLSRTVNSQSSLGAKLFNVPPALILTLFLKGSRTAFSKGISTKHYSKIHPCSLCRNAPDKRDFSPKEVLRMLCFMCLVWMPILHKRKAEVLQGGNLFNIELPFIWWGILHCLFIKYSKLTLGKAVVGHKLITYFNAKQAFSYRTHWLNKSFFCWVWSGRLVLSLSVFLMQHLEVRQRAHSHIVCTPAGFTSAIFLGNA